ncbi:MAG TPA: FAD-binding protein [Anaerolineales bacterium]|nr:FAD-binding protein [Anaerolineales bacterium]
MSPANDVSYFKPQSISELQDMFSSVSKCLPRGGGSKPPLSSAPPGSVVMEMTGLAGVLEYDPEEFTITALAGTPVREVSQLLAQNGQYFPFDPILSARGATLGGSVAAGVSGSGRYRYGGVRDFLLGVQFLEGGGKLVRGGGKVVKNAAGFDLPKLLTGSLGRLGILVEVTFKVFPKPEAWTSAFFVRKSMPEILDLMQKVAELRLDLHVMDIAPTEIGYELQVRLAGLESALTSRLDRLTNSIAPNQSLSAGDDQSYWESIQEMSWVPAGWSLVKVPMTPSRIPAFEAALASRQAICRYSVGGQLAWVAIPEDPGALDSLLKSQGLAGLVLFGPSGILRLGEDRAEPFLQRVKQALDPAHRFLEV